MNWKIRFMNVNFWVSFVPALVLLVQVVMALFGVELDLSKIQQQILDIVNALFAVLAILGIPVDHTTPGIGDSDRAKQYIAPGQLPPEK